MIARPGKTDLAPFLYLLKHYGTTEDHKKFATIVSIHPSTAMRMTQFSKVASGTFKTLLQQGITAARRRAHDAGGDVSRVALIDKEHDKKDEAAARLLLVFSRGKRRRISYDARKTDNSKIAALPSGVFPLSQDIIHFHCSGTDDTPQL